MKDVANKQSTEHSLPPVQDRSKPLDNGGSISSKSHNGIKSNAYGGSTYNLKLASITLIMTNLGRYLVSFASNILLKLIRRGERVKTNFRVRVAEPSGEADGEIIIAEKSTC